MYDDRFVCEDISDYFFYGGLAQLAEHVFRSWDEVGSSNLSSSTFSVNKELSKF